MHKLDTTSGHLPYYKQIKEFYKKDIQDGVLAIGDRVDSEMEIQEMYDVSRITARPMMDAAAIFPAVPVAAWAMPPTTGTESFTFPM